MTPYTHGQVEGSQIAFAISGVTAIWAGCLAVGWCLLSLSALIMLVKHAILPKYTDGVSEDGKLDSTK